MGEKNALLCWPCISRIPVRECLTTIVSCFRLICNMQRRHGLFYQHRVGSRASAQLSNLSLGLDLFVFDGTKRVWGPNRRGTVEET